ncbi:O-antigen ligase family protein [Pseudidiomarina sp. E22-M8]|uniref:O-antigen ligase family protein n=1 Tax=Pseudidiomarina sp. E22-M8 TaxID=3424768 RepID=UPI00403C9CFA
MAYGFKGEKAMQHVFTFAFAVNVFPVAFMPQQSMAEARFLGIPLAYIPILCAGVPYLLKLGFINSRLKNLIVLMSIFIFYITATSFYPRLHSGTFVYYFSWIFNFLLFIAVYSYFAKKNIEILEDVITKFFTVLIAACVVGIVRYFVGFSSDANFMPMVNRNGTVVFLVMASSLLFYLMERNVCNGKKAIVYWSIISITLLLMQSRSGLFGFMFVSFIYFFRIEKRSLSMLTLVFVIALGVLFSPLGDKISDRVLHTGTTLSQTITVGIEDGENDHTRYMLMLSAIEIFKNNPVFGVGVGLPNYRAAFDEHVGFYDRDSKAHNFYLSYLAELGIFGFSLLLLILLSIYRLLAPMNTKYRAFRVSFLGMAFMMTMNEYILLPELWFFYGMLGGMSYAVSKQA